MGWDGREQRRKVPGNFCAGWWSKGKQRPWPVLVSLVASGRTVWPLVVASARWHHWIPGQSSAELLDQHLPSFPPCASLSPALPPRHGLFCLQSAPPLCPLPHCAAWFPQAKSHSVSKQLRPYPCQSLQPCMVGPPHPRLPKCPNSLLTGPRHPAWPVPPAGQDHSPALAGSGPLLTPLSVALYALPWACFSSHGSPALQTPHPLAASLSALSGSSPTCYCPSFRFSPGQLRLLEVP